MQTKSVDKCICPYCEVIFYVSYSLLDEPCLTCPSCHKVMGVDFSIEYTCTTL